MIWMSSSQHHFSIKLDTTWETPNTGPDTGELSDFFLPEESQRIKKQEWEEKIVWTVEVEVVLNKSLPTH